MKSQKSPVSFAGIYRHARSLTLDSIGRGISRSASNAGIGPDRIPPELWLKIFAFIPLHLLPSMTLTCRLFSSLAQPLMFFTISTHPEALATFTIRPAQIAKYRKVVADRMEFLFSPQIRPTVRKCKIAPPSEEYGLPSEDLIDSIFATLPLLPNLRILECRYIRLTPKRLEVLQRLKLTAISLELCFGEISDFAGVPSVPLQTVTFKYPDASLRRDKASPCLLFLSPSHVEQLNVTTTLVLSTIARSQQPFVKLRTLDIPVECVRSDMFISALSKCPALEHLSLTTTDTIPHTPFESLPDGVLPLLNSYRGPHQFAAAILNRRASQSVEISVPSKPHRLQESLVKLERNLKSLFFLLDSTRIPPALLNTIHLKFRTLTSLTISEPAMSSSEINDLLAAVPAHRTLEHITIRIQGRDRFNLWVPPDEMAADASSCFNKVRVALLNTYPSLRTVRFMHGIEGASVAWQRSGIHAPFRPALGN
ncbi:hypothetical protein C8J57DRAFT_351716 [Mycena rebaudengoi]|nr:hypothetical protein C8J57DRAFT_351716 [Mycena rebaudengoi]